MSVIYATTLKSTRMTAVRDAIDAGPAAGKLKIGTANMAVVIAVFTLNDPCGTISNGVLTLSGFPKTVAATGAGNNIAAAAEITDSNDNVIVSGLTVDTTAADITLDNTNINNGQNVSINTASIPHG